MADDGKKPSAINDLLWLLGILAFLFIAWLVTVGPLASRERQGFFDDPSGDRTPDQPLLDETDRAFYRGDS